VFVGAIGLFALAVAAIFTIGLLSNRMDNYKRSKWPRVRATIKDCSVRQLKRRKSVGGFYYRIECDATYILNGQEQRGGISSLPATYEHRTGGSWAYPGIDELRAWVRQHPPGTEVIARSDPEWQQTLELDPNPTIFAVSPGGLDGKIAGIAAVIGLSLIALVAFVPR